MRSLQFNIDKYGYKGVTHEPKDLLLARFLTEEVQRSLTICQRIINEIKLCKSTGEAWWGGGNYVEVEIKQGQLVEITDIWFDTLPYHLSTDEFIEIIESWCSYLHEDK